MRPVETYWDVLEPLLPQEQWTGGELLAVRFWRLVRWSADGSVRLQSLWRNDIWHGPVFTADHKPLAEPDSISGVYACKECYCILISRHGSPGSYTYEWLGTPNWIWGWVALSGQVVDHERGFRAERAVVRSLHLGLLTHLAFDDPSALAELIRGLEDRYQCLVQPGHWVCDEAFRTQWLAYAPGRTLPSLEVVSPGLAAPAWQPPVRRKRILRPPALRTGSVVRAFLKAERELGTKWPLMGRGHCRRVSIRGWYSRFVRPATKCWLRFTPHESGFPAIVFPLAIVRRAARILRVRSDVLIGQEFGR